MGMHLLFAFALGVAIVASVAWTIVQSRRRKERVGLLRAGDLYRWLELAKEFRSDDIDPDSLRKALTIVSRALRWEIPHSFRYDGDKVHYRISTGSDAAIMLVGMEVDFGRSWRLSVWDGTDKVGEAWGPNSVLEPVFAETFSKERSRVLAEMASASMAISKDALGRLETGLDTSIIEQKK